MKLARKAINAELEDLPDPLTADAVTRRALKNFELTRAAALTIAARQRAEYVRLLSSAPIHADISARVSEVLDGRLLTINWLLPRLAWFANKLTDVELATETRSWLDVREQLELGDEVAQLSRHRLTVRTKANRIKNLKSQAASGTRTSEMASWLRQMLGADFSFDSFVDYFSTAFGIDPRELSTVANWVGFGEGGDISDSDLDQILQPLMP